MKVERANFFNRSLWLTCFATLLLIALPIPHTVAMRLLALLALVILVAYQWSLLDTPTIPCKPIFIAWLVIPILFLPFAISWDYSLGEVKTEVVYGILGFLIFFAINQSTLWLRFFIIVIGMSASSFSVIGIIQSLPMSVWDELSLVGGSASFATYVITVLPLALPAWWLFIGRQRFFVLSGVSLILLSGLLTNQRIVLPVILIQLIIATILLKPDHIRLKSILLSLLSLISVLSTIAYFSLQSRQAVIGVSPLMEDPRLLALERTLSIIAESPWVGFGFGREAMKLAHPEINDIMWHAHNTLLNYGVELGIVGIVLILGIWSCLAFHYWRIQKGAVDPIVKSAAVAGLCIVLGVIARNQVNDMFHRDLSLLFWCINGMLLGFLLRQQKSN